MKTRRIIAIILAAMMILPVWSQPVSTGVVQTADESAANQQDSTDMSLTSTFNGSGTADDPYIIATAADFIAWTNALNSDEQYSKNYFKQTANIDLAGNDKYVGAISTKKFYGTYDGQGHTVNVDLTAEDDRGILPYVYGKIYNLGITGTLNLPNGTHISAFARSAKGSSVIANCFSTLNLKAKTSASGIIVSSDATAKIYNCYFAGTLDCGAKYPIARSSNGTINNCYFVEGTYTDSSLGTPISQENAKTTLAGLLNDGRSDAATALSLEETKLFYWYSNNSLPVLVEEEPKPVDVITGTGTADDPYIINSAGDFITFTNAINNGEKYTGKFFKQTVNIDLAGNKDYVGAATSGKFYGTYDGCGNKINVKLESTDERNIFPYVYTKIANLGTTGSITFTAPEGYTSSSYITGIARSIQTGAILANCYSTVSITAPDRGAGLCGSGYGTIINCYFAGTLNSKTKYAIAAAGKDTTVCNNCYYTTGILANYITATSITEETAKATLASLLNEARTTAAAAAGVNVGNIAFWKNTSTYPEHFYPDYTDIIPKVSKYTIEAGKEEVAIVSTDVNYIGSWNVDKGDTDVTYTISDDKKTLTITSGTKTGKVTVKAYSTDNIPISNQIVITVTSNAFYLDSLESITLDFEENAYVTDTYNAVTVTGNGTKQITITGKGYNGALSVNSQNGELLATIYLTGTHNWRPGLNIFTGTLESYNIETDTLFEASNVATLVENPIIDDVNDTPKVLKISNPESNYFGARIVFETPIDLNRPLLYEYDYTGNINKNYWILANTYNSDSNKINTFSSTVQSGTWNRLVKAFSGKEVVDPVKHPQINSLNFQVQGEAGNENMALYLDNFSLIPSYKVEFFDEKGNKIDNFYYPRKNELTNYFYTSKQFKIDYNPNTHYVVNGTPVATNGVYNLNYEDLFVTVIPNSNAVMFSGQNATTIVPEGNTYVIPSPHELPGFTADHFIYWTKADGTILYPGTTVNTSDITGTTIYAYCDESAFTRTPVNGAIVNFASEQYNNWLANYHLFSVVSRSDGTYEKEKGVIFSWQDETNAKSYEVLYSTNKDMSDAVTLEADGTTATAHYLFAATDYYWQIKTTYNDNSTELSEIWKFTTADIHRLIPEIQNVRDPGGRLTEDGKYRVKQGIMYRGKALVKSNRTTTDKFGIIADLDLRGSETGWITSSPLGDDIIFKIIEGTHYYSTAASEKHYGNPVGQQRFAEEIRFFTDMSHFPLYYHCAGGRDRTGMLTYIIGAILGVEEEILFRDYELTWLCGSSVGDEESATLLGWMKGFTDYVNTNFEGDTFKERMEGYVRLCGVTDEEIDQIRANLLEEVKGEEKLSKTLDTASIRTNTPQGIRYACYVDTQTGAAADEYGFIIAAKSTLEKAYPNDTAFENLMFNQNGDMSGVLSDGKTKYEASPAYVKGGIDKTDFLTLDDAKIKFPEKALKGINDDGYYFTVVLLNIPQSHYGDAIVGKSYVKIDGEYYYGDPVVRSIYDVAVELSKNENLSDEVRQVINNIIKTCEENKDLFIKYDDLIK